MSAACLLALSHAINIEEQLKPSKIFAQQGIESVDPNVAPADIVVADADDAAQISIEGAESGGHCGHCSHCHTCDGHDCPNLQDAVIELDAHDPGFGTIQDTFSESSFIESAQDDFISDRKTCHATATNTCGLEVTNGKDCGEAKKYKCFDVHGKINVCEHSWSYGCDGETECSDGRFTKTAQTYSTLDDSTGAAGQVGTCVCE